MGRYRIKKSTLEIEAEDVRRVTSAERVLLRSAAKRVLRKQRRDKAVHDAIVANLPWSLPQDSTLGGSSKPVHPGRKAQATA